MNTILFEIIFWALIGLTLGGLQRFFNLWAGPGWRAMGLGALGAVGGGLATKMVGFEPATIGYFDVVAFFVAMAGAVVFQVVGGMTMHRNRTDPLTG
ncbi:MAG: hypothetical protein RIT81_42655 [Deltaproteobacteria bacterium]